MARLKHYLKGGVSLAEVVAQTVNKWTTCVQASSDRWATNFALGYKDWKPNLMKFLNSPKAREYFTPQMIERIKQGVASVSEEDFRTAVEGKKDVWINNTLRSVDKFATKISAVLLYEAEGLRQIQNIEDPKERMIRWYEWMKAFKGRKAEYMEKAKTGGTVVAYNY